MISILIRVPGGSVLNCLQAVQLLTEHSGCCSVVVSATAATTVGCLLSPTKGVLLRLLRSYFQTRRRSAAFARTLNPNPEVAALLQQSRASGLTGASKTEGKGIVFNADDDFLGGDRFSEPHSMM